MKKILLALALSLPFSGCYRVAVRTGLPPSDDVRSQTAHTFVWGLGGAALKAPCKPAIVEEYRNFWSLLATAVSVGLWTPITVRTTCAASPEKVEK